MELKTIFRQFDFNLAYARALVADVTDDQMTVIPAAGLVNHPAFTLGHLISGCAVLAEDLGAEVLMPEGWAELFLRKGPGDPRMPEPDSGQYPSREALLQELESQHNRIKSLLLNMDLEKLKQPLTWRFSAFMPTLLDVVVFMCVNHEAMHLGQLAAWRRAMELPSALGRM